MSHLPWHAALPQIPSKTTAMSVLHHAATSTQTTTPLANGRAHRHLPQRDGHARNPSRLPQVVIIGRPNVGKSTLFNRLVGKKLALVDDQPGVTRDRRFGEAGLLSLTFEAVDTAGWEDEDPARPAPAACARRPKCR